MRRRALPAVLLPALAASLLSAPPVRGDPGHDRPSQTRDRATVAHGGPEGIQRPHEAPFHLAPFERMGRELRRLRRERPGNDDFSAAAPITRLPYDSFVSTREATVEQGEPAPSCASVRAAGLELTLSGATVWYRFTASRDMILEASAYGYETFNPVLAVYSGEDLKSLTEVACSDNDGLSLGPRLKFSAAKGRRYFFQLGGFLGTGGLADFYVRRADGGGSIAGTVTDQSGSPVEGICVSASSPDDEPFSGGGGVTDGSGRYEIRGLYAGEHRVHFYDCTSPREYYDEWYDDKPDYETADVVPVAASAQTSGIDAKLSRGGSISGVVTDETGAPLAGICVDAVGDSPGGYDQTDADGRYRMGGLRPGEYRVGFFDCDYYYYGDSGPAYLDEWYDDKPDYETADIVVVADSADVTGIDARLALGGWITGVVTDESGSAVEDVCADAYGPDGEWGGFGSTDAAGVFRVSGLRTGQYEVEFFDCGSPRRYLGEWWDDEADEHSANPISVTQGQGTGGIDAALTLGGSFSGTVTDPAGKPVSGICVDVFDGAGENVEWDYTHANGAYRVGGLYTGGHTVKFYDCGPDRYAFEWYRDAADRASAAPVSVTQGSHTPGIDVQLEPAAVISGTVAGEAGDGISAVCVAAYGVGGEYAGSGYTYNSAEYLIGGLRAGEYVVRFEDCGYRESSLAPEWYDDKPDRASADRVAVAEGSERTGVNALLGPGGSISGTVTNEAGEPLRYVCVDVYESDGEWAGWGDTDGSGAYSVGGLGSTQHMVGFYDCDEGLYAEEWYDGRATFDAADPVPVAAPSETPGIDAALALWTEATAPPDTVIDSGPKGPTSSTEAAFTFSSTKPGSTFECRLDAGPWGPCSSPATYSGVPEGGHVFRVRATDPEGRVDWRPAAWRWTVDASPDAPGAGALGAVLRAVLASRTGGGA